MTLHLASQRLLLPSAQVSTLTTGSITLPSARGAFVPATAFQSISSTLVGTAQATVSFTSIPQTFKHLEIRAYHWVTASGNNWDASGYWYLNNDTTTSNYTYHGVYSYNTNAPTVNYSTNTNVILSRSGGNENGTYFPAMTIIRILDYSSTSKYKTALVQNGVENTGTGGYNFINSCEWASTSAISQIDFYAPSYTWQTGSTFSLYGILGE